MSTVSRRRIATMLLAAYCATPLLATAQVVINAGTPNDGRRAYVDQTQNGLPKVNIATPNGAGVSHNTYSDFNVGKQGLILNNGASNSNTALAGWIEGNPNLTAGNEAKLIFNEVVGGRQSQLNGFLEVAGKKADVIVANENGVTCSGCGFINTSRATLTTGSAIWGSNGGLESLRVRQGAVTIGADGLSSPDSRVDLLSQVINVQGTIHADRLNLVAGNNDIGYDNLRVTPATGTTGSLDVSLLGGMYANQIDLVATGAGVGVRVDGTLVSAGNVGITVDGQLVNTGKISAQGRIQTQANATTNSGSLVAVDALNISGATLNNTGALVGQDVTINLTNGLSNGAAGQVGANAALVITADSVDNAGKLNAKTSSTITTHAVTNTGEMVAADTLTLTGTTLTNSGNVTGADLRVVLSGTLNNSASGQLGATNGLSLQSSAVDNAGSINAGGQLKIQTAAGIENSGTIAAQSLELSADNFKNLGSGVVGVSGGSSLKLTTLNNLGRLHFEGDAQLDVRRINNPGQIDSLGQFNTTQAWTINNTGGLYGNGISLNTQALGNTGRIQANDLSITAYTSSQIPSTDKLTDTVINNSGLIAADHISVSGFGMLANSNQISTDVAWATNLTNSGQIELQANNIDNTGGTLLAKSQLNLDTQNLINPRATLSSKGDMRISASGYIDNREGLILHQGTGTASVQAAGAISNAKGQIEGQGESLSLTAGDIDNTEGQILQTSTRDALSQPSQLNITASAGGTNTGELRNIKGSIGGSGNVTITAHSYTTDASTASISSGGSLSFLNTSSTVSNPTTVTGNYDWNSDIATATAVAAAKDSADQAAATAQQTAATLVTAQTTLQTAQATQAVIQTSVTQAQAAVAAASTTAAKTAAQTTLDQLLATQASNDAAVTQAQAALTTAQTTDTVAQNAAQTAQQAYAQALAAVPVIQTGTSGTNTAQPTNPANWVAPTPPNITLASTTSQTQAGRNLTLNLEGGLLDNRQGKLVAVNDLSTRNAGNVLAGQMQAGSDLNVTAAQLEVTQQLSAPNTQIVADTLIVSGQVQGSHSLTLQANRLTNSGTLTGNTTTLKGRSSDTSLQLGNTGLIQGNTSLSIQADQVLNQATLASGGDLSTQTNYLENQALIYSTGNQTHLGQDIVNNAGRLYALGDIAVQGNAAGDNANSLLNYIGRIEAQGDITLKANTITNRAVTPTANARAIVTRTDDGVRIISTARDTFNTDGKTAEILAGKNLTLRADEVHNEYGVLSARLNANIGTRLLQNRSFGAIQTQNMVVRAACFNCHQTISYAESWGGVIASGGTATINATTVDNQTVDSRDGFAGIANAVDERAGSRSPLTQAFVNRFGIVAGPTASSTGSAPSVNLNSPRALSDGIVLNPSGSFDFSHFSAPNPQTGLFEQAPVNSPYLIRGRADLYTPATNDQYTQYKNFVGSDYMLERLGLSANSSGLGSFKLLGDAWYETQLVQDQLYALTGRTHLAVGTDTDYDLMRNLMDAGLLAQVKLGLSAGDSLSAEQQAALTQDIVWPEWQVVNGQRVMVPKVYVAHQDQNNDSNKGARIVGTDVAITTRELKNSGTLLASNSLAINASGTVSGGGSYSGGKTVALVADSVDLKNASIQSGGWLNIDTANDLTLAASQIKAAGDARLSAGGALIDTVFVTQSFNI